MKAIEYIQHLEKQLKPELLCALLRNQYAWWLLEKATDKTKAELLTLHDLTLTQQQQEQLERWLKELVEEHKPIAYILGTVPFGPLSIMVKPPVLIPRPETEEWVLNLIDQIKKSNAQHLTILDLCAGSGCIALLLAHMLPNATIYATDICKDALSLMQQNKKVLEIKNIHCIQSDLFEQLPDHLTFDLIVSNPPYITATEYAQLAPSVSNWEHKHALYAADEGLAIIKNIIAQAPHYIKPNQQLQDHGVAQLSIEIGWQQGQQVKKLMQKKGYTAITIEKDSASKDRVVSGRIADVATATLE